MKPTYYTRQQTAEILKISLPTLDEYVKRKIIAAKIIGSRVRFTKVDIELALITVKKK